MTHQRKKQLPLIVGRPALVMIDFQRDMYLPGDVGGIPRMPGVEQRVPRARALVDAARRHGVPVIFIQEVHRAITLTSAASWMARRGCIASRASA